ncbi:recombinase family protein [Streptomyces avidinii]|uniref:recombinase family protein n=1 Tax=Streptomyces avidinii TaxID=1895 RepID=UPI00386E110F
MRPEYNAALADLRPADTLTVTMLDRLGRNMIELITSAQDLAERDHGLCSPPWRRSSGSSSTSGL